MMAADNDEGVGRYLLQTARTVLDYVQMAGEAGQSDQVRPEIAENAFIVRFETRIEEPHLMTMLLQSCPEVFQGQGLKKKKLIGQRITTRGLDEKNFHLFSFPYEVYTLNCSRWMRSWLMVCRQIKGFRDAA